MKIYTKTGVPKFDKALLDLDNHLNVAAKTIATRKSYGRGLRRFMFVANKLPEECTKEEILECMLKIKQQNDCKYATLKLIIYTIKYYLRHVANRMDLFTKIPIPITKKYNIEVLNVHEIKQLFNVCRNPRERLIIQLLYETGIRVSELLKINIDDFDFHNNSLVIRDSKNRKTRTVYFGENLVKVFFEYLKVSKSLFSDTLFTRQFHPFIPMSKSGVRWVMNSITERSGIRKRVNTHAIRHAFAVHYLNFGGTIYQLQKLLGHSHLQTTCYYLQHAVLPDSINISILDKLLESNIPPSLNLRA